MALRWVWLTLFGLVLALTGCAKKDSSASSLGAFEAEAMAPARGGYAAKRAPARARPPSPAPAMADGLSPSPDAGATMDEAPEPAQRMIAYSARTTVRVLRQRDAIDAITDAVAALGGFVERIDRSRVIVRVPVDTFEQGLAAVQAVGEVTDERIFAADVTESFQDVALRLDTATATRERLVELLARTEDANQKMALIREIQRLTDQIDTLTAQRETLLRLTSLSRITIDLVERQSLTDRRSTARSPAPSAGSPGCSPSATMSYASGIGSASMLRTAWSSSTSARASWRRLRTAPACGAAATRSRWREMRRSGPRPSRSASPPSSPVPRSATPAPTASSC